MSMWTDWFIADATDAEAIASIVTEERDHDDWPHLELSGVIELQLMALWGVLKGTPGKWVKLNSTRLHQVGEVDEKGIGKDGLVSVTRVDARDCCNSVHIAAMRSLSCAPCTSM